MGFSMLDQDAWGYDVRRHDTLKRREGRVVSISTRRFVFMISFMYDGFFFLPSLFPFYRSGSWALL